MATKQSSHPQHNWIAAPLKWLAMTLALFIMLFPHLSHAESRVFFAEAGKVSAMVICEESSYARTYSLFTNGLARMHFDPATKTLDSLKFALLMRSFVTSSPQFAQEWNERRPLTVDKEDEVGFVQGEPAKFENGKAIIKGQLLIHNIRKDISFEAALNKFGRVSNTKDIYDDGMQTLGMSIHGTFKRSDFMLGGGDNSAFNDEAILMLDIVAK